MALSDGFYATRSRRWRAANPERARALNAASQSRRHERLKREVVDAYGGACTCCGERDLHFLTVEHIGGVPNRHRYPSGARMGGTKLLGLIVDEGFPDDITILCFNCNCSRGRYGYCPYRPDEGVPRYVPGTSS